METIRVKDKLAQFTDHWSPKIVGQLNGQHVKLVKFAGSFDWHQHAAEDEMFLVVHGSFRLDYREPSGRERSLDVGEGEFVIVPRGTEHRPTAATECHVMLFEPAGTLNTGNVRSSKTVDDPSEL